MKKFVLALLLLAFLAGDLLARDIDSIIRTMTPREKIAQLIYVAVDSQESPELKAQQERLIREGLGGIIVMDDKLVDNMRLVNDLQRGAKIPLMVSIDGEWGAAMRYYEYAAFPRAMQLGALNDEALAEAAGRAIGEELSEIKVFMNFAPVVDVNNNPENSVIKTRSMGQTREKVANLGVAFMRGMQSANVWGSAKHFPGHGDTNVDSHKALPVLTFDRARLDSLELYPFRAMIDAGVAMVMVGHLSVPALDPTGTPASISYPIVTGLLRNELGFNGVIITDALEMKGVAEGNANAAIEAYKAGVDIMLMPEDAQKTLDDLCAALKRGEIDEADLDARVRRALLLKQCSGMLADDYTPYVDATGPDGALDTARLMARTRRPETEALIQEICDRSMTVVRGKLRRPLNLRRRMAFTTRPKVAYVAFNAVTPESACFGQELSKSGRFDRFDLPSNATDAQIDSVGALLRGYRNVVVVFHSGRPVPRTGGPQRFAAISPEQFARVAAWSGKHRLHGVYLGVPYDLNKLPEYNRFKTFILGYSDTKYNNIAAARALTVRGSARGSLPVDAGGLPAGYHSNLIR
jgi:beta-glucosidase-like glycosyl hydrolase